MATKIGKTVQIIRQVKGLKLSELAKRASVSTPFLSLVESGDRQPSLDVIRRLATALDVPIDVLILSERGPESSLETSDSASQKLLDSIEMLTKAENKLKGYLANN